ncbi:hypothetical protein Tsp_10696 [Trichinella spiralis]|uniref:hypothetical protein n=1 Tax=Trichinella spiralis TaxID=6334 RepID=UPI0001EFEE29|nr:hypothetical protein Tsp_10696 [Trichinella spiralis]
MSGRRFKFKKICDLQAKAVVSTPVLPTSKVIQISSPIRIDSSGALKNDTRCSTVSTSSGTVAGGGFNSRKLQLPTGEATVFKNSTSHNPALESNRPDDDIFDDVPFADSFPDDDDVTFPPTVVGSGQTNVANNCAIPQRLIDEFENEDEDDFLLMVDQRTQSNLTQVSNSNTSGENLSWNSEIGSPELGFFTSTPKVRSKGVKSNSKTKSITTDQSKVEEKVEFVVESGEAISIEKLRSVICSVEKDLADSVVELEKRLNILSVIICNLLEKLAIPKIVSLLPESLRDVYQTAALMRKKLIARRRALVKRSNSGKRLEEKKQWSPYFSAPLPTVEEQQDVEREKPLPTAEPACQRISPLKLGAHGKFRSFVRDDSAEFEHTNFEHSVGARRTLVQEFSPQAVGGGQRDSAQLRLLHLDANRRRQKSLLPAAGGSRLRRDRGRFSVEVADRRPSAQVEPAASTGAGTLWRRTRVAIVVPVDRRVWWPVVGDGQTRLRHSGTTERIVETARNARRFVPAPTVEQVRPLRVPVGPRLQTRLQAALLASPALRRRADCRFDCHGHAQNSRRHQKAVEHAPGETVRQQFCPFQSLLQSFRKRQQMFADDRFIGQRDLCEQFGNCVLLVEKRVRVGCQVARIPRRQGRTVSRRSGGQSPVQSPTGLDMRQSVGHLCDDRFRHGHRQAGRAFRHSPQHAEIDRRLLSRNWACRTRRPAGPLFAILQLSCEWRLSLRLID